MTEAPIVPTCRACPLPLVCEACESCAEHCAFGDPIACAEAVAAGAVEAVGEGDPRTEAARAALVRARERARGN